MKPLPTIRWVFFDAGHTIVDLTEIDGFLFTSLEELIKGKQGGSDQNTREWIQGLFGSRTVSGYSSLTDYLCARGLLARKAADDLLSEIARRYVGDTWRPYDDVLRIVPKLSESYRLGIIANQPSQFRDLLARWGLLGYWKCISISEEMNLIKPDPKIFSFTLKSANASPQESVMIGDRLDLDVRPAKKLGFHTIRLRRGLWRKMEPLDADEVPDATVESLYQVPEIIETMATRV